MTDQLRVSRESSILPDSFKMIFRPVQVCAVPNYSIDMPPLTLMTVVQIRPGRSLSLHAPKLNYMNTCTGQCGRKGRRQREQNTAWLCVVGFFEVGINKHQCLTFLW